MSKRCSLCLRPGVMKVETSLPPALKSPAFGEMMHGSTARLCPRCWDLVMHPKSWWRVLTSAQYFAGGLITFALGVGVGVLLVMVAMAMPGGRP